MPTEKIKDLFASNIERRIEEVIKVDQTDEDILIEEIDEYQVTDSIRRCYTTILDRYLETPNKPHEGIAIWVSGFFGSGKSSFAKMVGLALENRSLRDKGAALRFAQQTRDPRIEVLLRTINERIPTETVVFDLSTDRGIRSGNQMLTEIMYRELLERLGYARDLDLAELEITLEEDGRLDDFMREYNRLFNREWDVEKGKVAFALSQASRVMQEMDPKTYPVADSWVKAAKSRADISANLLAERSLRLMKRRKTDRTLVFVIDEVGQFVARDVQKMLDLQGVVQALGRAGRGAIWVVVTSQERLSDVVGGIDDNRVELARLMDRFPQDLQVHLEPADISEVTSKRVLSKNSQGEKILRAVFEQNRGRLINNTCLTADINLPELTADRFIALYPLLPYQIDLIIQVVSGLRTQGGAGRHVGGANRTIIKLAQQLLINPAVALGEGPVGRLVTIEHVYDLVKGNIDSEIRDKIDHIATEISHPLAQPVAKSICLLQFVKSVHRTAENIAATLYPAVDADSLLSRVNEALTELERAHKVRKGDDGYRIPTPAEDDWERQRASLQPKPGDVNRIHSQIVETLWQPQPQYSFLETKTFKAGLNLSGRPRVVGDITFQMYMASTDRDFAAQVAEARKRSQTENKSIFWVVSLEEQVDRATVGYFRSEEMLTRKERTAQTKAETALVAEEKRRLAGNKDELKRLIHRACLAGTVLFRGNDRSPGSTATDLGRTASAILGEALPEVFDRFGEAAARVQKKDFDALTETESLRGLTPIFQSLKLIKSEGGQPVFETDRGPLREVLGRIENHYSYGRAATGKSLADELEREPFGWEFDVVRLFVLCLLRAGKIDATSKGQTVESAQQLEAREVFSNNNLFRQASFRPKQSLGFEELVKAADAFQKTFGKEIPELTQGTVAYAIREAIAEHEEKVREMEVLLRTHRLPGAGVLTDAIEQMRTIRSSGEDNAILTFNGAHAELKEAIKRANDLAQALTEPALRGLIIARETLERRWEFLNGEQDTSDALRQHAVQLADILERETFFTHLPAIDQHIRIIKEAYKRCFDEAVGCRSKTYSEACEKLRTAPGWELVEPDRQQRIAQPLVIRAVAELDESIPIAQLRADTDACTKRLADAVSEVLHIVEGNRLVQVSAANYFEGGVETEEQLGAALYGLREECTRYIAQGKKVFLK
jgi:hypothetical protein